MAKYNGKTRVKVTRSKNKLYRLQGLNTVLLVGILVYMTKESWLPMILTLLK